MYNFFVDNENKGNGRYLISGSDYNHIINVLRMNLGDEFLVSCDGKSDLCYIESLENETVSAKIIEENYRNTELNTKIYLFQGLPKSDKIELIIQKCVELGVEGIIPVEMNRCVVKLEEKKKASKQARWQAIAESAAKQSKRNSIPEVFEIMSYNNAVSMAKKLDLFLVPYENKDGMLSTIQALKELNKCKSIGIFIGPEGGFEQNEIDKAIENGGKTISLGKRILRTETAAITSVALCMLHIEMNENGENNETASR